MAVLELREADPTLPPLPRPGEEKLGPFALRSVEPTEDGRGWRLAVQPLTPGMLVVHPMDLGDGRKTPELRISVPRTVPFGAPWMGVGGGQEDLLPFIPFPWAWASLLSLPLAVAGWLVSRRWLRGAPMRRLRQARRAFSHHWPPPTKARDVLDAAHASGRDLLATHFGEEARSWGTAEFHQHRLDVWATWAQSLDAARFGRKEPPFPPLKALLAPLEAKR
jgi:hypothetical protein